MAIESYYTTLYLINYTESVNDQGRAIKTASAEVSFNGLINQASSTEVLTNKKLDIDADYKLFCDVSVNINRSSRVRQGTQYFDVVSEPKNTVNRDHHYKIFLKSISKETQ